MSESDPEPSRRDTAPRDPVARSERDAANEAACPRQDDVLFYWLGSLEEEPSASLEEHLTQGCGACAEELKLVQEVVAQLDLALTEIPVAPFESSESVDSDLRARLVQRVREEAAAEPPHAHASAPPSPGASDGRVWQTWSKVPGEVVEPGVISVPASDEGWQQTAFAGVDVKPLSVDVARKYVTMLIRMAPGTAYPRHRHAGREECFVISGELRLGEQVLHAGDFQVAEEGSLHGVQSTRSGCTLLVVSSQHDELL